MVPFIVLCVITTSWCRAQSPTLYGMTSAGGQLGAGNYF